MAIVCTLGLIGAQLLLPRRLAFLPLLIAIFHQPNLSILSLSGLDFSITRILIAVGLIRAAFKGALIPPERSLLDLVVVIWSTIAILSAFAQVKGDVNPLSLRLGMAYNFMGAYLYVRYYLSAPDSALELSKCLTLVLAPLALFMSVEKATQRNPYAHFGGVSAESSIRDGRVRSNGPFSHAILAGTAGASSLPLTLIMWRRRRSLAITGAAGCIGITFCSGSSGPVLTLMAAMLAVAIWRWRDHLKLIRRSVIAGLVGLHIIMKAPVWYLMARIDLTGSSTGYHRARLIDAAFEHLGEWWLIGTSYTRHWMVTGVSWSADQTDITNHYIKNGVIGGLPLMFAFIWILLTAFRNLGRGSEKCEEDETAEFARWCVGATLFAHCVTFLSVSYFDQVGVLLCFAIGLVPSFSASDDALVSIADINQADGFVNARRDEARAV